MNLDRRALEAKASWFVPLLAGAVYAMTAARGVLGGDNGELVGVAASGGVAHPPGYPLYILWLHACGWLPAVSPAHRAALATAILGALMVGALVWAAEAWGARPGVAAAVALVFAFGPGAWALSTQAEVFTMNAAIALAIVALSAKTDRPVLRVAGLGLFAGLGIANHHSIVLLAPIGLFAAVRCVRERQVAALAGIVALAVGLTPYVWLLAVARHGRSACTWGDIHDLASLFRHASRAEYGTFQLSVSAAVSTPLAHIVALGKALLLASFGLPLLGIVVVARRRIVRLPYVMLVLAFVLAGPGFVALFNLPLKGTAELIVARFYLLPLALAMHLAALALDALALPYVVPLVSAFAVARAALSYPDVREEHGLTIDRYATDVLVTAEPRAIILASGDDRVGPLLYAQCATKARPDVVVVVPDLLLADWYTSATEARLGAPLTHARLEGGEPVLLANTIIDDLLRTERPLYVTDWFVKSLERAYPSYPIGPLVRITADLPSPDALADQNAALFERFADGDRPLRETRAGLRLLDYARPWNILARVFDARGQSEKAARCREHAAAWTPR